MQGKHIPWQKRIKNVGDCWEWQGATSGYGYPVAYSGNVYLHRKVYEDHHGSIPIGYVVDHICENKLCLNSEHLRAITHKENVTRHNTAGRHRSYDKREALRLYKLGYTQRDLATKYGVDPSSISRALKEARHDTKIF